VTRSFLSLNTVAYLLAVLALIATGVCPGSPWINGPSLVERADAAAFPALISYVEGKVQVKHKAGDWAAASPNDPLTRGDRVRTRKDGKAEVKIADAGTIRLSPRTEIEIPEEGNSDEKISLVKMLVGKTWSNISQLRKNEVFEVQSPTLVAAVEGTRFVLIFDPRTRRGQLFVLDGTVKALNELGEQLVRQAQKTQTSQNQPPDAPTSFNTTGLDREIQTEFRFEDEGNVGDQTGSGETGNVTGDAVITVLKPAEGETYGTTTIEYEGSVADPGIENLRVIVDGVDIAHAARVLNGIFKGTVSVAGEGNHEIEFSAREGTARVSKKVRFKYRSAGDAGSCEAEPSVNISPLEGTTSRGIFVPRAVIVANPPVEKARIYFDNRLYGEANVINNQFERTISLANKIGQIKVVPVYKGQEWSRSQAVYRDSIPPIAIVDFPTNGVRYTKDTTGTGGNVISFVGTVMDDTLMKVEYQINSGAKQTITLNGVNSGDFSERVLLPVGESTIYLFAYDYFGNQTQTQVKVAYDSQTNLIGATVKLKVTDRFTGAIIVGAAVRIVPVDNVDYDEVAITDSNGNFTFAGVPYGRYVLVVNAGPGYQQTTSSIFTVNTPSLNVPVQVLH
jgi:hypothetical protein